MRIFVAVTDKKWFTSLSSSPFVDEVNFWRPSSNSTFKALEIGELLLFKLHSPNNFIAGGGFFTRFLQIPVNTAWEVFKESNGVGSLSELRERISFHSGIKIGQSENPTIGCIMLAEPFFLPQNAWIPMPSDFSANIVQGKGYDSEVGEGRALWDAVCERLRFTEPEKMRASPATQAAVDSKGFGKPQLILPRLGQGLFRILVTDFYEKKCAVTAERTLPVLDAAHIKPYELVQRHEVWNGLLLRSDLHRLFDGGYMGVDPGSRRVLVSRKIKEEFTNGRDYYKLEGLQLREPNVHHCRKPRVPLLCEVPELGQLTKALNARRILLTSPLQQINRRLKIRYPHMLRQRRMLPLQRPVHLPRHSPVTKVPRRRRSELRDVLRFGKIHLEQAPDARCQRQRVQC